MSRRSSLLTYGPTPEQMTPRAAPIGKDDFTGMVYCPMKFSNIAVLRCAEYQQAQGCGAGCAAAVKPEIAAAVAANLRLGDCSDPSDGERGRGTYVCATCGGHKKMARAIRCVPCGHKASNGYKGVHERRY